MMNVVFDGVAFENLALRTNPWIVPFDHSLKQTELLFRDHEYQQIDIVYCLSDRLYRSAGFRNRASVVASLRHVF